MTNTSSVNGNAPAQQMTPEQAVDHIANKYVENLAVKKMKEAIQNAVKQEDNNR